MRALPSLLILLVSLSTTADPRQVYTQASPHWLNSVGQLSVPGIKYFDGDANHFVEHCTATLVADNLILSGWHCIEFYGDLSRDIIFTLPNTSPPQQRIAQRVADGGGMEADWLLLKLDRPVHANIAQAVPVTGLDMGQSISLPLTLAGYSRDDGLGSGGKYLSYHPGCKILAHEWYRVATDCLAYKGASGGPVVHREQIIGVVSSGDSRQLSYYTPSISFLTTLRLLSR